MKILAASLVVLLAGCATRPVSAPTSTTAPAATAPASNAQPSAASARFDRLADAYFEDQLVLNPTNATAIGDKRYNAIYKAGFVEENRQASMRVDRKYLTELATIDVSQLDPSRRVSYEILKRSIENSIDASRYPSHLQPVNQFYNFGSGFAQLGSGQGIHPFKTVGDYDDFLGRISGFETAVDAAIANMRIGMQQGITQPRVLMEKAIPQLAAHLVEDPSKSLFYGPVTNMPASFSEADRARLTSAYTTAIRDRIVPAYRRLHDFLRDEYLPRARTTVGLSALPNGKAWYDSLVRRTTTTNLTSDEIHEIGLREVARIHREMERVKEQVGFRGDLQAFFTHLETDPKFKYASREEMLADYRAAQARIDASTDRIFDLKPKANYEIRPVEPFREKSAAGGSYMSPAVDGSRPGVFYLNTYDPGSRSRTGMEALLLHEGSPGHHFQISLQQELEQLPKFRRFGGQTAYVEGWGLYSETLGKELGLYTDPYQFFGALSGELWRAIRLVVDTGMHAKGWTREQAIEYAQKNSANSDTAIVAEVERFLAIPSQALAYKIGELKITELRRKAERALGPKFDLKAFHRAVLEDGALPLDVLEAKIDRWIAERS